VLVHGSRNQKKGHWGETAPKGRGKRLGRSKSTQNAPPMTEELRCPIEEKIAWHKKNYMSRYLDVARTRNKRTHEHTKNVKTKIIKISFGSGTMGAHGVGGGVDDKRVLRNTNCPTATFQKRRDSKPQTCTGKIVVTTHGAGRKNIGG